MKNETVVNGVTLTRKQVEDALVELNKPEPAYLDIACDENLLRELSKKVGVDIEKDFSSKECETVPGLYLYPYTRYSYKGGRRVVRWELLTVGTAQVLRAKLEAK